ncbi:MAG TPA: hypothetical protein V6C88_04750, partial [Chroococcidiopsis sp.]
IQHQSKVEVKKPSEWSETPKGRFLKIGVGLAQSAICLQLACNLPAIYPNWSAMRAIAMERCGGRF